MILDRTLIDEYPFDGAFYDYAVDPSKPLDERTEEEILVLSTKCDIQQSSKNDSGGNLVSYSNIYVPFDVSKSIPLKRGMTFKGSAYGLTVNGIIVSIGASQLGGLEITIKDFDT